MLSSFAAALLLAVAPQQGTTWIWISPEELASIPESAPGWGTVLSSANAFRSSNTITLADQDDDGDTGAMAAAFAWHMTGDDSYRAAVEQALTEVVGSEDASFSGENHTSLELSRNVTAVVIAAQLISWESKDAEVDFLFWVDRVRFHERNDGRSIVSTHEDRPNNWGTHAGASRLACAIYLDDQVEIINSLRVFAGWMGRRDLYAGFDYGGLDWQSNPSQPVGINPRGATIGGHNVDGVLPDDQRRGGGFSWPPPGENYVYEALQGALAQAVMADRLGFRVAWRVKQRALLRAFTWLHEEADFPAGGDDGWQPWLVNRVYSSSFPAAAGARSGKAVGFTEWTCNVPTWPAFAGP